MSILVAIGVRSDGYCQALGIAVDKDKAGWGSNTKKRSLQDINLFIPDVCIGLVEPLGE